MNKPRAVFNRLFVPDTAKDRAAERVRYQRRQSLLDNVMRQSKALELRLGRADRERLGEYLASIREVELQLDRNQKWLDHPKPEVDTSDLQFDFKTRPQTEAVHRLRRVFPARSAAEVAACKQHLRPAEARVVQRVTQRVSVDIPAQVLEQVLT